MERKIGREIVIRGVIKLLRWRDIGTGPLTGWERCHSATQAIMMYSRCHEIFLVRTGDSQHHKVVTRQTALQYRWIKSHKNTNSKRLQLLNGCFVSRLGFQFKTMLLSQPSWVEIK